MIGYGSFRFANKSGKATLWPVIGVALQRNDIGEVRRPRWRGGAALFAEAAAIFKSDADNPVRYKRADEGLPGPGLSLLRQKTLERIAQGAGRPARALQPRQKRCESQGPRGCPALCFVKHSELRLICGI